MLPFSFFHLFHPSYPCGFYPSTILLKKPRLRDIEIKNNLTVTRGEVGRDDRERGEAFSETTIKDTWTKPRGAGIREGRWGWLGHGGVVGEGNADNCT